MGTRTDKGKYIMISFLAVLIVFSVLILVHEAGHFFMAKRLGIRVERFSFGFGPKLLSFKKGETEYLICAIPLGGYVKMAGDEPTEQRKGEKWEFLSNPPIKRFGIIIAGPLTNYLLAFLLFSIIIFSIGITELTTVIGNVYEEYPAYQAGFRAGDKVLSVNGENITQWEDLVLVVSKNTDGEQISIVVERDGQPMSLKVKPKVTEVKNIFGQTIKIAQIGIASKTKAIKVGFLPSFYYGAKQTLFLSAVTYKGVWYMLTRKMSLKESAMGPIGIMREIGKAAKIGIISLLGITAYINLAIAIFNLLPIPILDGGHILFLALEKIRGKRINPRIEQIVSNIAISFLMAIMLYVSWNDIMRTWGDKIQKLIQ